MTPHPLPVPAKISKKGEQIPLFLPENVLHGHQQMNMTQDLMKKKKITVAQRVVCIFCLKLQYFRFIKQNLDTFPPFLWRLFSDVWRFIYTALTKFPSFTADVFLFRLINTYRLACGYTGTYLYANK